MKRGISILAAGAIALGAFALGHAVAEEGGASDMAAWEALAKTGEKHAELAKAVGNWTIESKAWMAPGSEPVTSKGTAVFTSVLDGRFIRQEFRSEMMGAPYHGVGYVGFNNATGKYEQTWIDNWGTGFLIMTGEETEAGKAWTYRGSYTGPGGVVMKCRSVLRKLGDDQQMFEIYNDVGQGEMKNMEILYTRAK